MRKYLNIVSRTRLDFNWPACGVFTEELPCFPTSGEETDPGNVRVASSENDENTSKT